MYIDTKWTVTGYFGMLHIKLWFAEEEEILGKHQEFYKGWADGVFYSCDFAGQSKTTIILIQLSNFLPFSEFKLVNHEKAFSRSF